MFWRLEQGPAAAMGLSLGDRDGDGEFCSLGAADAREVA